MEAEIWGRTNERTLECRCAFSFVLSVGDSSSPVLLGDDYSGSSLGSTVENGHSGPSLCSTSVFGVQTSSAPSIKPPIFIPFNREKDPDRLLSSLFEDTKTCRL